MAIAWQITGMENEPWTYNWSTDINPVKPDRFDIQPTPEGLQIFCAGPKYAGALASQVNPLKIESTKFAFKYRVTLDPSIAYGQVIETDTKFTDAAGWTYNGSLQWVIVNGWMIQIDLFQSDTGVKIPLSQGANDVEIVYKLDYSAHTIEVVSVNGTPLNQAPIPAAQIGWQASTIVTQLQLCLGANGGAYDLLFSNIGYEGQG